MSESKSILVIDDEPGMRDLVSRLFTEAGYEVALASDGQEGLEAATNGDFDLAILDMSLPKMNGLEVLASVKQIKPDLPLSLIHI